MPMGSFFMLSLCHLCDKDANCEGLAQSDEATLKIACAGDCLAPEGAKHGSLPR